MSTIYERLLASKRQQMEHHYAAFQRLEREVLQLEDKLSQGLLPEIPAEEAVIDDRCMPQREKSELRMQKILILFEKKDGRIVVEDVMYECKISKNAAKEWMNSRIDMDPESCLWERWNGLKTVFVLKNPQPMSASALSSDAATAWPTRPLTSTASSTGRRS